MKVLLSSHGRKDISSPPQSKYNYEYKYKYKCKYKYEGLVVFSWTRRYIISSREQIQAPLSLCLPLINLSSPREATKQPTRSEADNG